MPITAAELKHVRSIKTGSAGNSTAQADPSLSLGKYLSTTVWAGALHDLFAAMGADENAAGTVQYRCIFVRNTHATLTATDTRVFLPNGDPAGGAAVAIAVDPTAASAIGSAAAQAVEIANETAAPAGVAGWVTPTTYAAGIVLGDIAPGQCRAYWIRRTGANSDPLSAETVLFRARAQTLA